jgi:hypothetical protein
VQLFGCVGELKVVGQHGTTDKTAAVTATSQIMGTDKLIATNGDSSDIITIQYSKCLDLAGRSDEHSKHSEPSQPGCPIRPPAILESNRCGIASPLCEDRLVSHEREGAKVEGGRRHTPLTTLDPKLATRDPPPASCDPKGEGIAIGGRVLWASATEPGLPRQTPKHLDVVVAVDGASLDLGVDSACGQCEVVDSVEKDEDPCPQVAESDGTTTAVSTVIDMAESLCLSVYRNSSVIDSIVSTLSTQSEITDEFR